MVRARLTSKGQVTIPVEIRRRYGLETGSEVDFVAETAGPRLVPLRRRGLLDLYGSLPVRKPWPGKDAARKAVGRKLGAELRRKGKRS